MQRDYLYHIKKFHLFRLPKIGKIFSKTKLLVFPIKIIARLNKMKGIVNKLLLYIEAYLKLHAKIAAIKKTTTIKKILVLG